MENKNKLNRKKIRACFQTFELMKRNRTKAKEGTIVNSNLHLAHTSKETSTRNWELCYGPLEKINKEIII